MLRISKEFGFCYGKVKDIYTSKELWRGSESIYTLKHGQCVARDSFESKHSITLLMHGKYPK
jgi:hypothetical protein